MNDKIKSIASLSLFTLICYWMISHEEKKPKKGKINILKGGKGDRLSPKDVDPKELAMGIKTEMEHTTNKRIAKEVALDHLSEFPDYYSRLTKAGL